MERSRRAYYDELSMSCFFVVRVYCSFLFSSDTHLRLLFFSYTLLCRSVMVTEELLSIILSLLLYVLRLLGSLVYHLLPKNENSGTDTVFSLFYNLHSDKLGASSCSDNSIHKKLIQNEFVSIIFQLRLTNYYP